jgi:hypothetical protein
MSLFAENDKISQTMKLNYDNMRPFADIKLGLQDNGNVRQSVIIKIDNNWDCLHSLESLIWIAAKKKKEKSSLCHIIVHIKVDTTFSQETENRLSFRFFFAHISEAQQCTMEINLRMMTMLHLYEMWDALSSNVVLPPLWWFSLSHIYFSVYLRTICRQMDCQAKREQYKVMMNDYCLRERETYYLGCCCIA